MKKKGPKLFVILFNIIASILVFSNEKQLVQIDNIWIHFLLIMLIIWNILLFYMFLKKKF